MANILVVTAKVPFTRGGAEVLVTSLVMELKARGHMVDTVELPFSVSPKEGLAHQIALWRSLNLTTIGGREVDLVIATKFPSYAVSHPRKSVWLVHQHRPMYELFGGRYSDFSDDPRDELLRRELMEVDRKLLGESSYRSGISRNVVERLRTFHSLEAEVLYPPLPLGTRYRAQSPEDYILSVGRLCAIKRVDLMIKALPMVHQFVKLKIVGLPDEPGIEQYFRNEIAKHHLSDRIEFLGRVSDETLIDLYARARAVFYAPFDEDYGYVTLEAFASSKPVVTAHDSGGVLEFVRHEENGLCVAPTTDAVAQAFNRLIEDGTLAERLGARGREDVQRYGILEGGWERVIKGLCSPLSGAAESPKVQESGR